MWKEFKEFAIKGNAIDLAVGVIIGAAFGGIINSLVKDILMPPDRPAHRRPRFFEQVFDSQGCAWRWRVSHSGGRRQGGGVTWNYGNFVTLIINFVIVAFCIFLVVKAVNKMKRPSPTAEPVAKDCPACAMSIPIKATRCPHCTTELSGSAPV